MYESIPQELRDRKQWVSARIVPSTTRPGKTDKYPIDPATGRMAESDNPATWGSFNDAVRRKERDGLDAIGFMFSADDPYTGIDIDDVIDADGNIDQFALDCLYRLQTYAERSQSKRGVHAIARASLPPGGRKSKHGEMYDAGRFFVFTGDVLDGYTEIHDAQEDVNLVHAWMFPAKQLPAEPVRQHARVLDLADGDLIAKAQAAHNGAKFTALWNGNTGGYPSHSEADFALCTLLGFWAGGDNNRVDALFRQSGLYREKWDKSHYADGSTYGQVTLANALRGLTQVYDGNGRQPPDVAYIAENLPPEMPAWMDDDGQELPSLPSTTPRSNGKGKAAPTMPSTPKLRIRPRGLPRSLLDADFPDPVWAVPDLITVGLTILAGRPKVGKSWLALQTAIAVGTGGKVLDRHVKQGSVLYLALEDNARRLQKPSDETGVCPETRQFVLNFLGRY